MRTESSVSSERCDWASNQRIDSMVSRPRPLHEKMTLFWHGHFVSALWDGVDRVDLIQMHAVCDLRMVQDQDGAPSALCLACINEAASGRYAELTELAHSRSCSARIS